MEEQKKEGIFTRAGKAVKQKAEKVRDFTTATVQYCKENKEVAVIVISSLVSVVGCGTKLAAKTHSYKKDKKDRKTRIYDPHTGTYHYLRKPMTREQERHFNNRIKRCSETGETYFDILDSMGILE